MMDYVSLCFWFEWELEALIHCGTRDRNPGDQLAKRSAQLRKVPSARNAKIIEPTIIEGGRAGAAILPTGRNRIVVA